MSTYSIIDTPWHTTDIIDCLKEAGVETVIRYYNNGNSTGLPQKRLELNEAQALSAGGLKIMVIFQTSQNEADDFSYDKGFESGTNAYNWAKDTIGQPRNSAIYFAVDYDASPAELATNIIPYFEGVAAAFKDLGGASTDYKVGAYGSGLVVNAIKSQGTCEYRWLSQSSGYLGTQDALDNGNYELHQIYPSGVICDIDVDYDVENPNVSDLGTFDLK